MKLWIPRAAFLLALGMTVPIGVHPVSAGPAPAPQAPGAAASEDEKTPDGRSRAEEILKDEHKQNLQDAAALAEFAAQLKTDLEKNDRYVLSLDSLKKLDEIEKLTKKIRARMRHN